MPIGCKFCTRCDHAINICEEIEPELLELEENHFVRCHKYSQEYKNMFKE